ncbi:acyl-CoA dehydrogenase family protein [Sedimenticola selenatireducens]|uniref:acyl-CoA dehydrogenase family protein n=1 Tax=Sedimenticola selenatireducens TaxID=191960 RepID=UPI002AABFA38|nr:acyl-CoA dehydrogenase family protein [Sedimenticola selenatireducens]
MNLEQLTSPVAFLMARLGELPREKSLRSYQDWWVTEGMAISESVDRNGTPWLRLFDRQGGRVDEVLFAPDYRRMLGRGYREGVIWRGFGEGGSLWHAYLLGYVTAFFDAGLYCPYTVSLATAMPLAKYGDEALQRRFLAPLLRKDGQNWQGATWMTEIGGGSDLGANVATVARPAGDRWRLTGDKYFASNVGAEVAVVAARPQSAPKGVRGLALFVLGRHTEDGRLNYRIRRLKDKIATRSVPTGEVELRDSEAWLLGPAETGVYLILEVLNVSRVANCIASVALAQRAMAEALEFARERVAFDRPILEHPLLARQFRERADALVAAIAMAWEVVTLLDDVWRQTPPYAERYHLFRLLAHLGKYWTAELAVDTAKWAMEVHGGLGVLAEYPVERWLREAMILAIWEGTSHRQMLDGLEAMLHKGAHRLLLAHLAPHADPVRAAALERSLEALLGLPPAEREAAVEPLFRELAQFTGEALAQRGFEV